MTDELARLREQLAAQVTAVNQIRDDRIATALREVPRHLFLPHLPPEEAYRDDAIVTKRDAAGMPVSSSSQPAIMAIMLGQLGLAPGQRVLEIGAGTGYNAALIKHIVGPSGTVVTIDIDADLTEAARWHLARAGYADVTVAGADGAGGWPDAAPYDRVIATVGVSDLAPAWLEQAAAGARIVVPLDVRGMQLSVAFARDSDRQSHWSSRSLVPCGFMRTRGALAGPERTLVLEPGLRVTIPDSGGPGIDPAALASAVAGPSVPVPTGVHTVLARAAWGLGLWLAVTEPRSCQVDEELPAEPGRAARLAGAPLRNRNVLVTVGIVDCGGIALLSAAPSAAPSGAPTQSPLEAGLTPEAVGFGPDAAALAADLAAHVRAWDRAGQPGTAGLHVDAYPRSGPRSGEEPGGPPAFPDGALVIERPGTNFIVYRQVA